MLLLDDVTLTQFADAVRIHGRDDDGCEKADDAESNSDPQRARETEPEEWKNREGYSF